MDPRVIGLAYGMKAQKKQASCAWDAHGRPSLFNEGYLGHFEGQGVDIQVEHQTLAVTYYTELTENIFSLGCSFSIYSSQRIKVLASTKPLFKPSLRGILQPSSCGSLLEVNLGLVRFGLLHIFSK